MYAICHLDYKQLSTMQKNLCTLYIRAAVIQQPHAVQLLWQGRPTMQACSNSTKISSRSNKELHDAHTLTKKLLPCPALFYHSIWGDPNFRPPSQQPDMLAAYQQAFVCGLGGCRTNRISTAAKP